MSWIPTSFQAFQQRPQGTTPLVRAITDVVAQKLPEAQRSGKKLLLMVATDGVPDEGPAALARWLHSRDPVQIPVVFWCVPITILR